MESPGSVALLLLTGFATALIAGLSYVRISRSSSKKLMPETGAKLKIRTDSGMYRSRVLDVSREGWSISAPLQRDSFVPLHVGESVVVEATVTNGIVLFRSEIIARHPDIHSLVLANPARLHKIERRQTPRSSRFGTIEVLVDNESVELVDVSSGGARLRGRCSAAKGSRVRLGFPWAVEVFGWILASDCGEIRVCFEERQDIPAQIETAPAV